MLPRDLPELEDPRALLPSFSKWLAQGLPPAVCRRCHRSETGKVLPEDALALEITGREFFDYSRHDHRTNAELLAESLEAKPTWGGRPEVELMGSLFPIPQGRKWGDTPVGQWARALDALDEAREAKRVAETRDERHKAEAQVTAAAELATWRGVEATTWWDSLRAQWQEHSDQDANPIRTLERTGPSWH